MNKSAIEWCDKTWNPITGCLHDCEYCYARKIAKRFGGSLLRTDIPIIYPSKDEKLLFIRKPVMVAEEIALTDVTRLFAEKFRQYKDGVAAVEV